MQIPCILCGEQASIIRHAHVKQVFYCCDTCGFAWRDRSSLVTFAEERLTYDQHRNSVKDPVYMSYFRKFINAAILPFCKTGRKGLDFGSGPSPVLATLLSRDEGYEMDIYDLHYAPETVYQGKQYDLITTTEVVEHLPDPLVWFEQFRDLLLPGGILAVMTLLHEGDPERFLQWHYPRDLTHISFFTQETMRCLASRTGLELIYSDGKQYTTFRKNNGARSANGSI